MYYDHFSNGGSAWVEMFPVCQLQNTLRVRFGVRDFNLGRLLIELSQSHARAQVRTYCWRVWLNGLFIFGAENEFLETDFRAAGATPAIYNSVCTVAPDELSSHNTRELVTNKHQCLD